MVLTGTPPGIRVRWRRGDVVEVEIDGLGRLVNTVVNGPVPSHAVGHRPANSKAVRAVALGKDYHRMKNEGYGVEPADYFDNRDAFLRRSPGRGTRACLKRVAPAIGEVGRHGAPLRETIARARREIPFYAELHRNTASLDLHALPSCSKADLGRFGRLP